MEKVEDLGTGIQSEKMHQRKLWHWLTKLWSKLHVAIHIQLVLQQNRFFISGELV